MFCPRCNNRMIYIRHFDNNRNYGFHQCINCYMRTHHKRLHWDDENNITTQNNIVYTKGGSFAFNKNQKTT